VNRLATAGNRIVDTVTGQNVLLRGINRSGLEYAIPDEDGFASGAGIARAEVEWIVREWGANIIRLPFAQDRVLRGFGDRSGEEYLRDIDRVVNWAARYGAYTLLDLQWIDGAVPALPDHESPGMWAQLARRYRDQASVLYDVCNEPHDCTIEQWKPSARRLIDAIRSENPTALVFVSGVDWGYDLRGFPLDVANVVYSTHIYRNKGDNWEQAFGALARHQPVFAGECGGVEHDVDWGRSLFAYLQDLGIGFTAWSWSDHPHLVHRYLPTEFGNVVRRAISG
jgi:aryl-phospho-beta-D-glucosidase BglC (GH1 family)